MESLQFERLKAAIMQADAEQCVELEGLVRQVAARRHGETALVRKTKAVDEARRCPHCGHTDVVKHGFDKAGRCRFRCRKGPDEGCGKTLINRHFRGVSTKYLTNYLCWAQASRRPGFGAPVIIEQALAA